MQLLTYLAQVRQVSVRNAKLNYHRVYTMRPSLPMKQRRKLGISHKVTVIIGIAHAVGWGGQNRNMVAWLMVVQSWPQPTICISSRSLAEGRK